MNLLEKLCQDKSNTIALYDIARNAAKENGAILKPTVKETCLVSGVNRTEVYEKRAQLRRLLGSTEIRGRGRPPRQTNRADDDSIARLKLSNEVLRYHRDHPGALCRRACGRTTYCDGFRRFILGRLDDWSETREEFCEAAEVPFHTLRKWIALDERGLIPSPAAPKIEPVWPTTFPNETCATITTDYSSWEGTTVDFLKHSAKKLGLPLAVIRRVLTITCMISPRGPKPPRYRGSTLSATPGAIVVTDGKALKVELAATGDVKSLNWQGIVDQATACHTAVVITDTENAEGVKQAYEETKSFLGRSPGALIHDNKPIHNDEDLRQKIEEQTVMIPATPGRPENKAVIEGEFGKFEQFVGCIQLDDANQDTLLRSAVKEVVRAYTAGINHAGRFEYDGKSRKEVVRDSCPDPEKDQKLIAELKVEHTSPQPANPLPSQPIARGLLDEGFKQFGLVQADPRGKLRHWLSAVCEPEAIRQGLAIISVKMEKGSLKGKLIHRYLVKVIRECQTQIELEREEKELLKFAETERKGWLSGLQTAFESLAWECETDEQLAKALAEHALFGDIMIERAFWTDQLSTHLIKNPELSPSVCRHVRRVYEADRQDRFQLLAKITAHSTELETYYPH